MVFEEIEERRIRLSYAELEQLKVSFRCVVEISGSETVKAECTIPFLDVYQSRELDLSMEKMVSPSLSRISKTTCRCSCNGNLSNGVQLCVPFECFQTKI